MSKKRHRNDYEHYNDDYEDTYRPRSESWMRRNNYEHYNDKSPEEMLREEVAIESLKTAGNFGVLAAILEILTLGA